MGDGVEERLDRLGLPLVGGLDTEPDGVRAEPGSRLSWRAISDWSSPTRQRLREPERRYSIELLARTSSIDALHDAASGATFFGANEDAQTVNVSRQGLCLRCDRPPWIGSRLLVTLLLNEEERPIELSAQVRWTRVDFLPGAHGARPVAVVGVELVDGAPGAVERYRQSLLSQDVVPVHSVAGREALG